MLRFLGHDGPIAFAHRGGSLDGRENSMAAFTRAVTLGYRYFETDVHATQDGVLIAFHDSTLDRVTDRTGHVARLPWPTVRQARIGGLEPIPLLAEVLSSWPEVRVLVDLKSDQAVAPFVELLRRTRAIDRVCVASFVDRRLERVRAALGPRLSTAMAPGEIRRLLLAAWGLLPRAAVSRVPVCVQVPLRYGRLPLAHPRLLDCAHALELPVHIWTVNDPGMQRRLLDLGVDGIMSDDLVSLRAAFRERGAWHGS
jgi:glycerophosphoryl diester phosphodiesterase